MCVCVVFSGGFVEDGWFPAMPQAGGGTDDTDVDLYGFIHVRTDSSRRHC